MAGTLAIRCLSLIIYETIVCNIFALQYILFNVFNLNKVFEQLFQNTFPENHIEIFIKKWQNMVSHNL